jgi:hypothetical protein
MSYRERFLIIPFSKTDIESVHARMKKAKQSMTDDLSSDSFLSSCASFIDILTMGGTSTYEHTPPKWLTVSSISVDAASRVKVEPPSRPEVWRCLKHCLTLPLYQNARSPPSECGLFLIFRLPSSFKKQHLHIPFRLILLLCLHRFNLPIFIKWQSIRVANFHPD